ncbi:MAG TPA: hypothetical protein VFO61_05715 [Alphaproteobacteria bacterium]|nr:hypothetical protein [Alphaproteobacteria bacterium]
MTRKVAKKSSFAMLLFRAALAVLAILALIWGANQVMFFLFREGLY